MDTTGVVREGGDEPSVRIYSRRARQVLLGAGAWVFVLIGVLMIVFGDPVTIAMGAVCVLVFGVFRLLWVRMMGRSGPAVLIDRHGVTDRSSMTPGGFLPWDQIVGLDIVQISGQRLVAIEVADPQAVLRRAGWWARQAMRASMRMTGTPVNIAVTALPITAEQLLDEIVGFARRIADRAHG